MAFVLADRVKETTITTGTGTVTLLGAGTSFVTFSSALSHAVTTYYTIANPDASEWETGTGTYNANTLARTTVLRSSNSDALVNFSAGNKDVFISYPADKAIFRDANGNVGINTTTPKAPFHIEHTATAYQTIGAGTMGLFGGTSNIAGFINITIQGGSATGASIVNFADKDDLNIGQIFYNHNGDYMSLYANNIERLKVDSDVSVKSGNLVISTAGKGIDMNGGPKILFGTGTPEGAVTAAKGSIFMRSDGGAGTSLYSKESGTGSAGWIGK